MGLRLLFLLLFVGAEMDVGSTEDMNKAVLTREPDWTPIFTGESVSLTCSTVGQTNTTHYRWEKTDKEGDPPHGIGTWTHKNIHEITDALEDKSGNYTCVTAHPDSHSNTISLIVAGKAIPVIVGPPQSWLTEGDSVTLSCEVRGSSTGWTFHWYKTAPYRPGLEYVYHESRIYYVELLSDSSRGAGGSYTLSPAALRHTGVYVCRAERGETAYQTEFSQPQPFWVTGSSPLSLLVVVPDKTQHFALESLSLSCEGSGNSTGWRLRWLSGMMELEGCPSLWEEVGSSCSTSLASSSDSGVYWCQSESGEQSNPVNITVNTGSVILESPVHPVTEGDPLTLRCRYRYQPSHISADFYRDGTLLHTSSTGEMTIPAVSKAHEGLYKCSNPERGESTESWITVEASSSDDVTSDLVTMGAIAGVMIFIIALGAILLLIYCLKKRKAGAATQTPLSGQQGSNISQNLDQSQPGHHLPNSGTANAYDPINIPKQKDGGKQEADLVYSEMNAVKTTDKDTGQDESGHSDITYAQVTSKKKTDCKGKDGESTVEVVYSEVKGTVLTGI